MDTQYFEEYERFLENASENLHFVDGNGIILWANRAELDSLGYTRDEYFDKPIAEFHVDDDVIADILQKLLNFETIINYPARLKASNHQIVYVLINSNVYEKDGTFIHTRCFSRTVDKTIYEAIKDGQLSK